MPGPLHGYHVVDLTSMVSGPLATMILADQGADVIKVEAPNGGDHTRAGANQRGGLVGLFPEQQPKQALHLAGPQDARWPDCSDAARGRCRCIRAELPPGSGRADRNWGD